MKQILRKTLMVFVVAFLLFSCSTTNNGLFGKNNDKIHEFDKGLQLLSDSIIKSLKSQNLFRVAINDFIRIDDQLSVLGKAISEELITGFFGANAPFDLVERRQLEAALTELNLSNSGIMDEDKAAELGRLLGADALVIGSITPFETYFKLNARIFSVQDGKVAAAASIKIKKSSEVMAMYENIKSPGMAENEDNKAAPKEQQEKPETQLTQTIDDFSIILKSVTRQGDKIWTDYTVMYNGTKSEEWIGFYNARILDSDGNEYEPVSGGTLQPWDGWGGLTCVPQVPMKGRIPFEVGVAEISTLALLEVEFRSRGKLYFKGLEVK